MKYSIEAVVGRYPGVSIGVLAGRGLDNTRIHPELEKDKADALKFTAERIGAGSVTGNPRIASWRDMYRSFGTKPADYHPPAEALVRRALKVGKLPAINAAVDSYNAVSVRHLIPAGGFDTNCIKGDIHLRFSPGGEPFVPLGDAEPETTYAGEVVYADDTRILTRRWNYRDCHETRITEKTRNLVMFLDGSPEIPRDSVEEALIEMQEHLERFCGGTYSATVADSNTSVIEIG